MSYTDYSIWAQVVQTTLASVLMLHPFTQPMAIGLMLYL